MWVDILFLLLLALAVFKGLSKGLIVALFSFISWIIGLAAALKLSSVVAAYLKEHSNIQAYWLPFLSFILVFAIVVILVYWIGKLLEKVLDLSLLGWVNKLCGVLLYTSMYCIGFSIILFFALKMQLVSAETLQQSRSYTIIGPVAPLVLDGLGSILPVFKDMFKELEAFFEHIAQSKK